MALVITLLAAGAILLLLETILPGMIAGIIGGICLIAGVVLAFVDLGPNMGLWILGATVLGLILGFSVWASVFPGTRMGRAFVSERTIAGAPDENLSLVHQTGSAVTILRPSGTALIGGHRIDVITEGGLIEKGTSVEVVAVEGARVIVRATDNLSNLVPTTNNQTK